MPTVGRYRSQQRTAPLSDARRSRVPIGQVDTPLIRYTPSPASYGSELGETLAQVGGAFHQQALAEREKEILEARAKQNRIATFEADTKLSAAELGILYHPQTGLLNRKGKDAFGAPELADEQFEKAYGEIWQSLSNDEQREDFDRLVHPRRKALRERMIRHAGEQMKVFENEEFESTLKNSREAAAAKFDDPVSVETELERTRTRIWNYAKDNGLGDEWLRANMGRAVSRIHADVVNRYLDTGQDQFAQNYFANWKQDMTADDLGRLEKPLQEGNLRGQSQRAADTILQTAATEKDALDLVNQITEPKLRDDVQSRVEHAWTKRKQIEREEREARNQQAAEAVQQRMIGLANLVDARKSTDAIPPGVWAELTIQERNALESYAKRLDEGRGKIETDQSVWYGLMRQAMDEPARFENRNLWLDRSKLSDSDFQELAKLQRSVREGKSKDTAKALDDFRTEKQIIDNTLSSIGINPGIKENDAAVARVHQLVAEDVQGFIRRNGKKPSNDEVQAITDDIVRRGYTVDGWFRDVEKPVVSLTIGDIPTKDRREIERVLREGGELVTNDAILDLFIRTQQRLRRKAPAEKPPGFVRPTAGR